VVAPFTVDELNTIFAAPKIRGIPRHKKAGGGEAARWLPLIGLFAGARMEEIAQLEVADIVKVGQFHAFRMTTESDEGTASMSTVSGGQGKSLKNATANRMVPIHDTLIACGFLDYVAERRKAGGLRVIPLVTVSGERCAKNWSRWFARFLDKRISKSASKNFHSFRHTFIDDMRDSLVGRDVIMAFVGHAKQDVTDRYGKGCSPRTMHPELKKLEYQGLEIHGLSNPHREAR
jgi:integrase